MIFPFSTDWLLKLRISFAIHLWAIHVKFAPKNVVLFSGINELKSSFCAMLIVLVYTKTTIHHSVGGYSYNYSPKWRWLALDIYLAASRLGKYPPLATNTEVNSCFSIY